MLLEEQSCGFGWQSWSRYHAACGTTTSGGGLQQTHCPRWFFCWCQFTCVLGLAEEFLPCHELLRVILILWWLAGSICCWLSPLWTLCLILSSFFCEFFRVRDAAQERGKSRFVSCILMVYVFAFDAHMCGSNAGTFASVVVCTATGGLLCVLVMSEEDSNMESRYPSVCVEVPVNIEKLHNSFYFEKCIPTHRNRGLLFCIKTVKNGAVFYCC